MRYLLLLFFVVDLSVMGGGCASSSSASPSLCAGKECYAVGALGPDWRVIRKSHGESGFFSSTVGGVIQSNLSCRDDGNDASLGNLTDHLLIGYTERTVRSTTLLPFARREALRTVVEAKLDGVPMVLDLFVFKRNGCVFDLSFVAPPEGFVKGSTDFQKFVDGFRNLGGEHKS